LILEKIELFDKNSFHQDEKNDVAEKLEKIDFGMTNYINNKFEFSNYHTNNYNEFEMEKANTEKMHNFQISLMDIFKGEQETKHMRLNLLSELEDFQGNKCNMTILDKEE